MSIDPAALSAPLEPEVAVCVDDWVRYSYESGLRNVAAQRRIQELEAECAELREGEALALEYMSVWHADSCELAAENCELRTLLHTYRYLYEAATRECIQLLEKLEDGSVTV